MSPQDGVPWKDANLDLKWSESLMRKRFGEDISQLIIWENMRDPNGATLHLFPKQSENLMQYVSC